MWPSSSSGAPDEQFQKRSNPKCRTHMTENSQAFRAFKHSAVNTYGGTEMILHTVP